MTAPCWRLLAAALALLVPGVASALDYPSKPIRLIIPFAPGGTNDVLARMAQMHLTEKFGQVVVPDNRPGHQGIIGTDLVVKAEPDGYTLGVISAAYTMNPATLKLPFDPVEALDFVTRIGQSFLIMTVGPKLPGVGSVKDLLAAARQKPGEIVLSTSGGFLHFATSLFASLSKERFNIVLYKGGYPATMDVIGGQVHAGFAVSTYGLPLMRSGKLKGLAVGTLERSTLLPELPTLDEVGIKGYESSNWYAIAAPAGTPKPIVTKLHQALVGYFGAPATVKQLASMGIVVDIKTTDDMRRIVPAEIEKWTRIAREVGMPRSH